jgi:hypothetical protein
MNVHWPESWIRTVPAIKAACAAVSERSWLGVPLDFPLRFAVMAGLYALLRRWLSVRTSAAPCCVLLLSKVLFDIVAVRNPAHPRWPHLDDVADVASGLAGIGLAMLISARRPRPAPPKPPSPNA